MSDEYRLFGMEMSPYSVKVRSFLRYKGVPHRWVVRSMDRMAEFGQYAKLPLVPCLACPDGTGMQDSTPIMERIEQQFPEPPVRLADASADFLSVLIEEYADEWLNKPMFHYRWFYEENAASAALRIAQEMVPAGSPPDAAAQMAPSLAARMVPRLSFVGSGRDNTVNAALIERSFERSARLLDGALAQRAYLFGGRPAMGDFGVYGQFKEMLSDPSPGRWLRAETPHLVKFLERMEDPPALADVLPLVDVLPGLTRLLREEIAGCFLPWSDANARAVAAGAPTFTVHIDGVDFTQETQKYHAKSLAELRRKFQAQAGNSALVAVLADTGCLKWLEA